MDFELKPFQIRVDVAERLAVFLCHDQYGPAWEQYGVETECREQAQKIIAAIEEWLPVAVEHRPAHVIAGHVTEGPEHRYVGAWIPVNGPRWEAI